MYDKESFHVFRDEGTSSDIKEKINRSNLPRKARNFSKQQLQLALRKKKECNAKAQAIVEALLDPIEDRNLFLVKLRDINQSHYDDVIEERAIQGICGYPLCSKHLTNVLKQKYVISLSNKKVYDITERKKFCSGECFKASNYIKSQMLTSPLWLRDQEDIPHFKLLHDTRAVESVTNVESLISELHIVEKVVHDSYKSDTGSCFRQSIGDDSAVKLNTGLESKCSTSDDSDLCLGLEKINIT
ncbi:putative RNA polymerase II subunit B1 CTD phosphatase RPAP2 homolog [Malaya genurostris]|uniref:putative RNA polymerase II subunit B1 CTD phosphatase RPAP2 homolog n=1 Tax=Malaya genurostris TaxID=325434 RepID=UPI0026F3CD59|nr:putative RNA polymerase II subunit B1 CTD phosphatase RPAP2 homolog [Malaya genurostris]